MTFRTRLLLIIVVMLAAAVGSVTWVVSVNARQSFERTEERHLNALLTQIRRDIARRGEEISRRVETIARADATVRMAFDSDSAAYFNEAQSVAVAQSLDVLEFVTSDGVIVSSAHSPARFGYRDETPLGAAGAAFLTRIDMLDHQALALVAVREVSAGDRKLYVMGGQWLDQTFLDSLVVPEGTRVLLDRGASGEVVRTLTLPGRDGQPLATIQVLSSSKELDNLVRGIVFTGVRVAGAGIFLSLIVAWWATARITRPVRRLAEGARKVAAGNWNATVEIHGGDEVGQLAGAFNQMTRQLIDQRDRLVQAERVAAWRELARRLAHELKNPLFPLQITIENLQRVRERKPEQFEEVFQESTGTLLAELANLKRIVQQFSEFAKMPRPEMQQIDVNEIAAAVLHLFDAQMRNASIEARFQPDPRAPRILADPEQLRRVLQNLVLNAVDVMPEGGVLTVSTKALPEGVQIRVADTGQGLTPEECERLFTPYYTTKQHGTGLGLAIVQSVISDHKGRIAVESSPGAGTAFVIELPA